MAIAFDSVHTGSILPGTQMTYAHVVNGTDRLLAVGIQQSGGVGDEISGVTYNGIAMSRALTVPNNNYRCYWYTLIAPATGTNNVVVSANSSLFLRGISVSLTGANQSSQPEATASGTTVSGTSLTTQITTTTNNAWVLSLVGNDGALAITAGAGVGAVRGSISNITYVGDSGSAIPTAGNYSMTWTSSSQALLQALIAITPSGIVGGGLDLTSKTW